MPRLEPVAVLALVVTAVWLLPAGAPAAERSATRSRVQRSVTPQRSAAAQRSVTRQRTATPRSTTAQQRTATRQRSTARSGTVRQAQPRRSTGTARQPSATAGGSIRYSQPQRSTVTRTPSSTARSGIATGRGRSAVGSSGRTYTVSPGTSSGGVTGRSTGITGQRRSTSGTTRSYTGGALGRTGTSGYTTRSPGYTTRSPETGYATRGSGATARTRGYAGTSRGYTSARGSYATAGGRSVWSRPPVRSGYRPAIAQPFRSLDRSRWSTILRPYGIAPIGGGRGLVSGYGGRYLYRPDGGRLSYYRPPAWGSVYSTLPPGAISLAFGGRSFYAWAGVFYQPWGSGYRVVRPPVGAVVSYLPPDYGYMDLGGQRYFYHDDVYYTYVPQEYSDIPLDTYAQGYGTDVSDYGYTSDSGYADEYGYTDDYGYGDEYGVARSEQGGLEGFYAVVEPPIGAEVSALPPDYDIEDEDGVTYYVVGDAWYLPIYRGDELRYLRVPEPD